MFFRPPELPKVIQNPSQNHLAVQPCFFSDFGPFWPPFWSPFGSVLVPFGPQVPPAAPKGASRAPPGAPLGPQASTKAPPRPLRPRPGHQNDPSEIDFGGSGPPFGWFAASQNQLFQCRCCRATCHRCSVALRLRDLVWPRGMRGSIKSAAPRRGAGRARSASEND